MSCSHEDGHGHSHNDDDHLAPPDTNQAQTLRPHIDLDNVVVLNEAVSGSGAQIIRPYEKRLETEPFLESDADEELLLTIPFTGLVKLHSVLIRSFGDSRSPREIRLFKNQDNLDFATVEDMQPLQVLPYPMGVGVGSVENDGICEFSVNRPKFANITSLTLHIPSNYDADTTALTFIGLRGDWQKLNRAPVVATYEAAANPAHHKLKQLNHVVKEA